jgi:hypothetical protein
MEDLEEAWSEVGWMDGIKLGRRSKRSGRVSLFE